MVTGGDNHKLQGDDQPPHTPLAAVSALHEAILFHCIDRIHFLPCIHL
jgi:hypothetical protein